MLEEIETVVCLLAASVAIYQRCPSQTLCSFRAASAITWKGDAEQSEA